MTLYLEDATAYVQSDPKWHLEKQLGAYVPSESIGQINLEKIAAE